MVRKTVRVGGRIMEPHVKIQRWESENSYWKEVLVWKEAKRRGDLYEKLGKGSTIVCRKMVQSQKGSKVSTNCPKQEPCHTEVSVEGGEGFNTFTLVKIRTQLTTKVFTSRVQITGDLQMSLYMLDVLRRERRWVRRYWEKGSIVRWHQCESKGEKSQEKSKWALLSVFKHNAEDDLNLYSICHSATGYQGFPIYNKKCSVQEVLIVGFASHTCENNNKLGTLSSKLKVILVIPKQFHAVFSIDLKP